VLFDDFNVPLTGNRPNIHIPPTAPKAQLQLLWLGSFSLREYCHPIEFRFQAALIMPKRLNTIGLFRKHPRAWMHYEMSQVQCKTFPFSHIRGFG